jgi:sugar phosphate permease
MISSNGPLGKSRAYTVVGAVSLAQFVCMGMYSVLPVALDSMRRDFGATQTQLSWAQSIVQILMPVVGIAAGALTDRVGPALVVFFAGLSLLACFLLSSLTQSVVAFCAVYSACFALCVGAMTAPGPTAIGSWFSPEMVGFAMSIGEAGVALGTSVLPLVAGVLLDHFDGDAAATTAAWRVVFRIMSSAAALVVLASPLIVQRDATEREEIPDEAATAPAANGNDTGADSSSPTAEPPPSSLAAVLCTKAFAVIFATQFLFGLAYFGTLFCVSPFARSFGRNHTVYADRAAISVPHAASIYTFLGFAGAAGALLLGVLSAAVVRTQVVVGASNALAAVCTGVLLVDGAASMYWQLCAVFGSVGFLCAGSLLGLPALVMENFGGCCPGVINTVMAVSFAAFGAGGAIAPPLMSVWPDGDVLGGGSYTVSFVIVAACFGLGGLLNLADAALTGSGAKEQRASNAAEDSVQVASEKTPLVA